tara:strand:+ start:718 stop:1302 length:585 start_codon:yes stop_codon:yes gene_type:complete
MKKLFFILFLVFSFTFLSAFTYKTIRAYIIPVTQIKTMPIKEIRIETTPIRVKLDSKGHYSFLDALGHQESRNRYDIVNRFGYMGRYQFGKSTLKTVKIKVSQEEFLNSPKIQEEAMRRLLIYNKKKLQKYIDKYNGKVVHGILVTESGILAAAHLGGAGSVKKWFRTGKVRKDGNGVKITSYMTRFGGYNLNI